MTDKPESQHLVEIIRREQVDLKPLRDRLQAWREQLSNLPLAVPIRAELLPEEQIGMRFYNDFVHREREELSREIRALATEIAELEAQAASG